jgi:hypothetical protein
MHTSEASSTYLESVDHGIRHRPGGVHDRLMGEKPFEHLASLLFRSVVEGLRHYHELDLMINTVPVAK